MQPPTWTIEIRFDRDTALDRMDAEAVLIIDGVEQDGFGEARKNPADPDVPVVAEEIATARALSDLAHHLLERAAHQIELWEGAPVELVP